MAETPAEMREANKKLPGGKLGKYKWYLVGGLALVAVLVFYFVNKSKSNAAGGATSTLAASGIDPATGIPYSQEYASQYGAGMGFNPYGSGSGGGFTGPAGPAGKTGPAGKRGPRGKTGPGSKGKGDHDHGKRGHRKKGSRTEAMTNAVAARRDWNTRIVPSPIRHSYRVL